MSAQPNEPHDAGPGCLNILIVDDSREGRNALTRILEFHGHVVRAVGNGAEALQALSSGPAPDVLITDLVLPDLDGREIARAASGLTPRPWVVLTTGWGFEADAAELSRHGIHQVMPKPLDIKELCRHLEAATRTGQTTD